MKNTTYILITKKYIYFIEGISSKQFNNLNFFFRIICWIIGLLLFNQHKYKKQNFSFYQYSSHEIFKNPENKIGIIIIKNDKFFVYLF